MLSLHHLPLPFLVTALLATACTSQGPDRETTPDANLSGEESTRPHDSTPVDSDAEGREAFLAFDGDGLRVFLASTGAARPIEFGTPYAVTRAALTTVLEQEPVAAAESPECGGRFLNWGGGFTTWFAEDRFAGWSVRDGDLPITTASGIGIGSTRAELESVYAVEVSTSSLGVEFTAGGMAGLLESARPDARITHLWAGETCIAR